MSRYTRYSQGIDISFSKMREDDIERVITIENSSFSNPWTIEAFLYELKDNRFSYPFVARIGDTGYVIGYICLWIIFDEMHILNLAVDRSFMRNGIGESLVLFGLDIGRKKGVKEVFLEVRRSNMPAISLYKRLDFYIISERKDYYTYPKEDALIMKKEMS